MCFLLKFYISLGFCFEYEFVQCFILQLLLLLFFFWFWLIVCPYTKSKASVSFADVTLNNILKYFVETQTTCGESES